MDNIYETIRYIFIGQVYTDTYENIGDGGKFYYKFNISFIIKYKKIILI